MRSNKPYREEVFPRKLRELRDRRRITIKDLREDRSPRRSLSLAEKEVVLAKTGRRCHLCGGKLKGRNWVADHIVPYAKGGTGSLENYLPAHTRCNSNRRSASEAEFEVILKLGAWLRTEIANETAFGKIANQKYCQKQKSNAKRRAAAAPR